MRDFHDGQPFCIHKKYFEILKFQYNLCSPCMILRLGLSNCNINEKCNSIENIMPYISRADFHLFKRRGRKISGGVQAAPLSELRQGLAVWVKAFQIK
jgi:hypothetical protein